MACVTKHLKLNDLGYVVVFRLDRAVATKQFGQYREEGRD